MAKSVSMIPVRGNKKLRHDQELYIKNQISELLEHRKLYREMNDNSKSKKDRECARLCLRTINDSLASFRKMVY